MTTTATIVAPATGTKQPKVEGTKDRPLVVLAKYKCGFCAWPARDDPNHTRCPSGSLNGMETRISRCACGCASSKMRRCFDCGRKEAADGDMISPVNWRCNDSLACRAFIEDRLSKNPTIILIREINARVAAERAVENERKRQARYEAEGVEPPERKPRGESRPKSGKCLHCGEPTKGGMFLPGHDASYLSSTLAAIREKVTTLPEALEQWESLGVSEALRGKLQKRVA